MERAIINVTYTALDIVAQGENTTILHHVIFSRRIMASNTPFSDMGDKENVCIWSVSLVLQASAVYGPPLRGLYASCKI